MGTDAPQYTEAQIKAAFWKMFHKAGEFWFDANEKSTQGGWAEFLEGLDAEGENNGD